MKIAKPNARVRLIMSFPLLVAMSTAMGWAPVWCKRLHNQGWYRRAAARATGAAAGWSVDRAAAAVMIYRSLPAVSVYTATRMLTLTPRGAQVIIRSPMHRRAALAALLSFA